MLDFETALKELSQAYQDDKEKNENAARHIRAYVTIEIEVCVYPGETSEGYQVMICPTGENTTINAWANEPIPADEMLDNFSLQKDSQSWVLSELE